MPDAGDTPSRGEVDARFAAAEAKTEARLAGLQADMRVGFGEIRSEMRALADRLTAIGEGQARIQSEQHASRLWVMGTVIAVGIAVIALAGVLYAGAIVDRANILSAMQAGAALHQQEAPTQPQK